MVESLGFLFIRHTFLLLCGCDCCGDLAGAKGAVSGVHGAVPCAPDGRDRVLVAPTKGDGGSIPVSYTHLTLPTKA